MVLPAEFSLTLPFPSAGGPGAMDLTDDAVLTPPPGRQLVLTADAMVAGVLPEDDPRTVDASCCG
jgi:thiamine-monophosphate kinase